MDFRYELITLPDGTTTLAKLSADMVAMAHQGGDGSTSQIVDITEEEYQQLIQQAPTNTMKYDTMNDKIMLTPNNPSNTEANQ